MHKTDYMLQVKSKTLTTVRDLDTEKAYSLFVFCTTKFPGVEGETGTRLCAGGFWFSHVRSRQYLPKGEKRGGLNTLQGLVIPMTRMLITIYTHVLRLRHQSPCPPTGPVLPQDADLQVLLVKAHFPSNSGETLT